MVFSYWIHPTPLQALGEVHQSSHQDGPENHGNKDSLCCRFLQLASYFSDTVHIHHVSGKSTTVSCHSLEHPEKESGCLENITAQAQDNQRHIRFFAGFYHMQDMMRFYSFPCIAEYVRRLVHPIQIRIHDISSGFLHVRLHLENSNQYLDSFHPRYQEQAEDTLCESR